VLGNGKVTGVRYRAPGGEARQIDTDFVFIGTGERPDLSMYAPLGLATDERGFVIADTHMRTSVPGVYAAGDLVGPPMEMFKARKCGVGAPATSWARTTSSTTPSTRTSCTPRTR
jgi:dihydrolipoamide dehydrogenase